MNLLLRPLLILFLIAAPYHVARGESANVIVSIACSGLAVGLSIDIDGAINARTAESVRGVFDQYQERQAKLKAGSVNLRFTNGLSPNDEYETHLDVLRANYDELAKSTQFSDDAMSAFNTAQKDLRIIIAYRNSC